MPSTPRTLHWSEKERKRINCNAENIAPLCPGKIILLAKADKKMLKKVHQRRRLGSMKELGLLGTARHDTACALALNPLT